MPLRGWCRSRPARFQLSGRSIRQRQPRPAVSALVRSTSSAIPCRPSRESPGRPPRFRRRPSAGTAADRHAPGWWTPRRPRSGCPAARRWSNRLGSGGQPRAQWCQRSAQPARACWGRARHRPARSGGALKPGLRALRRRAGRRSRRSVLACSGAVNSRSRVSTQPSVAVEPLPGVRTGEGQPSIRVKSPGVGPACPRRSPRPTQSRRRS